MTRWLARVAVAAATLAVGSCNSCGSGSRAVPQAHELLLLWPDGASGAVLVRGGTAGKIADRTESLRDLAVRLGVESLGEAPLFDEVASLDAQARAAGIDTSRDLAMFFGPDRAPLLEVTPRLRSSALANPLLALLRLGDSDGRACGQWRGWELCAANQAILERALNGVAPTEAGREAAALSEQAGHDVEMFVGLDMTNDPDATPDSLSPAVEDIDQFYMAASLPAGAVRAEFRFVGRPGELGASIADVPLRTEDLRPGASSFLRVRVPRAAVAAYLGATPLSVGGVNIAEFFEAAASGEVALRVGPDGVVVAIGLDDVAEARRALARACAVGADEAFSFTDGGDGACVIRVADRAPDGDGAGGRAADDNDPATATATAPGDSAGDAPAETAESPLGQARVRLDGERLLLEFGAPFSPGGPDVSAMAQPLFDPSHHAVLYTRHLDAPGLAGQIGRGASQLDALWPGAGDLVRPALSLVTEAAMAGGVDDRGAWVRLRVHTPAVDGDAVYEGAVDAAALTVENSDANPDADDSAYWSALERVAAEAHRSTVAARVATRPSAFAVAVGALVGLPHALEDAIAAGRAREVERELPRLYAAIEAHYKRTGTLPRATPLTPAAPCCGRCTPQGLLWRRPAWRDLGFAQTEPHYYSYQVVVEDDWVYARAVGDLDCDGEQSLFEIRGEIGPTGVLMTHGTVREDRPTE